MKKMIIRLWKKWFGREAGQVTNVASKATATTSSTREKATNALPMLERLETYLFARYHFRFNLLTEQAE